MKDFIKETIMTLTVTEKNHWKERIGKRIERTIEELITEHDPAFNGKIEQQARARAIESLGIAESYRRIDEIKAAIRTLETERTQITEHIDRALIPSSESLRGYYDPPSRIERMIKDRQGFYEKELLNESTFGKKILALRREQEELLDTVWLATSPAQIKNLWSQVNQLLGHSVTDLQSSAVLFEPTADDRTK
jgi:hypothetical protein